MMAFPLSRRILRCWERAAGVVVLLAALRGVDAAEVPSRTMRQIAEVRSLSREAAAEGRPVQVRGVVTWRGTEEEIVIQDETAGIWMNVSEAKRRGVWREPGFSLRDVRPGSVLEVEGISDPAGYAPVILPTRVVLREAEPLPEPRAMQLERFFSGADDCQRIEARGVVQGVQPSERGWMLRVSSAAGLFVAIVPEAELRQPIDLVDAEIRLRGVAVMLFNARGEITLPRVFLNRAADIEVMRPARPAFEAPEVSLARLLPFRPEPIGPHRVRVRGTVTFATADGTLFLQEGNTAVKVQTRSAPGVALGERVEASGFVDMGRRVGTMVEAELRALGPGALPAPTAVSPEQILEVNRHAMDTGQLATPVDYDGRLVRFSGTLLSVETVVAGTGAKWRITLSIDRQNVTAHLFHRDGGSAATLRPGSLLQATGIAQLEFAPLLNAFFPLRPTAVSLWLRSPEDLVVLEPASWWTASRLLMAVAIALAALGAAAVWIWQLRRSVRRQTAQLAHEISARRDAVVEFQATMRERNRLASDLHDTLLQSISGIGFQLEACASTAAGVSERALHHLEVARRMLDHAATELRRSVWTLRSGVIRGQPLGEALSEFVGRAKAGRSEQIELAMSDDLPRLPEFVGGNLFFVAQEAVNNALKHARARHVRIRLTPASGPEGVKLEVEDDGIGFHLGRQAGTVDGHFGLAGMQERIDRLRGKLLVQSTPGQGTRIIAEVPVLSFDDAIL